MSTPRTPILSSVRPTETPGVVRSTMKQEMSACERESAGPVLANTQYQSACTTPDIQHLVPLSTQLSPSRIGLGAHADHVAAGLRLREPEPGPHLAGRDPAHVVLLLRLAARDHHRAGRQAREQQHQRRGVGVLGDLFHGDGEAEDPGARPAVLLRDHQAEEARVAEELEEVLGVLGGGVDLTGPGCDLVLGQLADGGLELGELQREVKRHRSGEPTGRRVNLSATRDAKGKEYERNDAAAKRLQAPCTTRARAPLFARLSHTPHVVRARSDGAIGVRI